MTKYSTTTQAYSLYSGGTPWVTTPYVTSKRYEPKPTIEIKTSSVWAEITESTTYPIRFIAPDSSNSGALPPYHPLWDTVDRMLERLWASTEFVDPKLDDEWLDNLRSSWNTRMHDIYDNTEAGQ